MTILQSAEELKKCFEPFRRVKADRCIGLSHKNIRIDVKKALTPNNFFFNNFSVFSEDVIRRNL